MNNNTKILQVIYSVILCIILLLFIVINNGLVCKYQIFSTSFFRGYCYFIDNSLLFHCFPIDISLIISLLFYPFLRNFIIAGLYLFSPLNE
jgi:hypothetical protein